MNRSLHLRSQGNPLPEGRTAFPACQRRADWLNPLFEGKGDSITQSTKNCVPTVCPVRSAVRTSARSGGRRVWTALSRAIRFFYRADGERRVQFQLHSTALACLLAMGQSPEVPDSGACGGPVGVNRRAC